MEYQPVKGFKRLAGTQLAEDLWAILNTKSAIAAMKEASGGGGPAVVGIDRRMRMRFGEEVLFDQAKQMIRHMVRQIMEANGYILDKRNVRCDSGLFHSGATYRLVGKLSV